MLRTSVRHSRAPGRRRLLITAVAGVFLATPTAQAAEAMAGGYSPDAEYGRGSLVIGSDGNAYRALEAVRAKDPVTAKDASWQLANVAFDTTLDVPGRFESIDKAFVFLSGAVISDSATVTVQVAPGHYAVKGPLAIGHGQGNRVLLKGSKDAAKTTLDFGRGGGIIVDHGRRLTIGGLTLKGGQTGINVDHGSHVAMTGMVMKDFRTSILVEHGSSIIADKVAIETDDGDWGVKVTSTSRAQLRGCAVARTTRSTSLTDSTFGMDAETGAAIDCRDCEISGWMTGLHAGRSCALEVWGTKATQNIYGAGVYLAASLSGFDCSFDGNLDRGVHVHGGGAMFVSCQFRENKKIGICASTNGVVDFMGVPSVISGSEVGLHSFLAGRFHGVSPQFKSNGKNQDVVPVSMKQDDVMYLLR